MRNHNSPNMAAAQALKAFNYASPICVLIYFVSANIFIQYRHKLDQRKPLSRRRRVVFVSLTALITLCYAIHAVQYLPNLSSTPDDGLIHAISQFLLWITLSLILSESTSPSAFKWVGTAGFNLILEMVITSLQLYSVQFEDEDEQSSFLAAVHCIELFTLLVFTVAAIWLLREDSPESTKAETESLLGNSLRSGDSITNTNTGYNSIANHEDASDDGSDTKSAYVSNSDSDSDSDDDEEFRKLQEKRLESGWLEYLKAFKVFLPYVVPRKNIKLQVYFVLLFINVFLMRALNVLHPRQLGIIIDRLWSERLIPWKDIFLWSFLAMASSHSTGVGAANEVLENRISAWSKQELTFASLDHVMGLSMSFHDQKDSGEVIKAIEQAGSLNELLRLLIVDLLPAALDVAISLWYVTFLLDLYASFIIIAMIISFVYATYKITLIATVARRISARKERDESKLIYESVSNWFTVSYFNQKSHTMQRLARVLKQRADAGLWNDDLYTYIYFFQEGSEHLGQLAITILAAHRIIMGKSTVGDLVTLESYWGTITWPLYVLGHNYRRINSTLVDAERLLQLFQEKPAIKDSPLANPLPYVTGIVELKDVVFAYEGRESTLRGISLAAKPGQTVAFVGESGSGKSTLFKLLMRFYDVTSGKITIDGQDIRDVTLSSVRDSFSFVPQDSVLFNTTILENVRYGRLEATDSEIYEACKAASIHDKILSLPRGYLSEVGERGVKLSGGERQRISIARAFLKNAPIVLLDEATSAMDSQTESKIQVALKRLTLGRTTFVIAHRLSTVVEADRILVVSEGKIIEEGTHVELLASKGVYFGLWTKQAFVGG